MSGLIVRIFAGVFAAGCLCVSANSVSAFDQAPVELAQTAKKSKAKSPVNSTKSKKFLIRRPRPYSPDLAGSYHHVKSFSNPVSKHLKKNAVGERAVEEIAPASGEDLADHPFVDVDAFAFIQSMLDDINPPPPASTNPGRGSSHTRAQPNENAFAHANSNAAFRGQGGTTTGGGGTTTTGTGTGTTATTTLTRSTTTQTSKPAIPTPSVIAPPLPPQQNTPGLKPQPTLPPQATPQLTPKPIPTPVAQATPQQQAPGQVPQPALPPQATPQQTPTPIPTPVAQATPQQQAPGQVPQPTLPPQATPQLTPTPIPTPVAQATPQQQTPGQVPQPTRPPQATPSQRPALQPSRPSNLSVPGGTGRGSGPNATARAVVTLNAEDAHALNRSIDIQPTLTHSSLDHTVIGIALPRFD